MSNPNETVKQVCDWLTDRDVPFAASIAEVKFANPHYDVEGCMIGALKKLADRILAAHKRDREAARRRAERSAIYNMMESFPNDWECNPEAVRKWMTAWYKNADDLCEGGLYAER